jgi:hypothetical protein
MDVDTLAGDGQGIAGWRKGQGFKAWEQELLHSPEVRRKADVAQLCELYAPCCRLLLNADPNTIRLS